MRERTSGLFLVLLLLTTAPCLAEETVGEAQAVDFSGTLLSADVLPYGTPPVRYEGARSFTLTFKTSTEVLQALVPAPLRPDGSGLMSVTFAAFKVVSEHGGTYNEAYLSVPVKLGDQGGNYLPLLYLDEVLPIIGGREIWGYRKVAAEIKIVEKDGTFHGTVAREGKTVVELGAQFGEAISPTPAAPLAPVFNLKLVPSVVKGADPDVKQLTASVAQNMKVHELRPGMGKVSFGSLPSEPLASIPVTEVVHAVAVVSDFELVHGKIAHDYLAEN